MKKMVCEICGSSNIIKKDGVFVCQTCGMQYSADDAKKLLQDVPDETPVVAPNNSGPNNGGLDNLYKIARRAKTNDDAETAAKIYEQISIQNLEDWEAAFFSAYFRFRSIKIAEIQSTIEKFHKSSVSALNLVKDAENQLGDVSAILDEISSYYCKLMGMFSANMANHYGDTRYSSIEDYDGGDVGTYYSSLKEIGEYAVKFGDLFAELFGSTKCAKKCWEYGISELYEFFNEQEQTTLGLLGLRGGFDPKYSNASDYSEEDFGEDNIYDMTTLKLLLSYIDKLIQEGENTQELEEQKNYLVDLKVRLIKKNNESKNEWLKKKVDPNYRGETTPAVKPVSSTSTTTSTTSSYKPVSAAKKPVMLIIGIILLVVGLIFFIVGISSAAKVNAAVNDNSVSFSEASKIIDQYTGWEVVGFLFGIPDLIAGLILTIIGAKKAKRR